MTKFARKEATISLMYFKRAGKITPKYSLKQNTNKRRIPITNSDRINKSQWH